jgi:CubicO group peptidase (beta-lactamase class C family)
MTHTSGLRCHIDVLFQTGAFARPAPAEAALETMARQGGVNFPVGERYAYNNGGYNLLSTVIERVTGEDFGAYQARRIFRPLGMTDTAVKRTDTELLPNSASLHVPRPDGGFERGFFGIPIAGEGAMVSTIEDMLAWQKHWHRPTIGAPETWRQMRRAARLNSGRSTGYGPGLRWSEHRGLDVAHHAGGVLGGVCMALTVPALELDVILIANRSDAPVQTLAFDVIDACVEGLPAPLAATGTAPIGTYWSEVLAAPLEVTEADGQAFAQLWDMKLPMRRAGEGRIACSLPAAHLVVETVPGQPDRVAVEMGGSVDLFERVPLAGDDPAVEAIRLAGTYRCEDADAVATVTCDGDRVRLRMAGPFGRDDYGLRRFSPLTWISTLDGVGIGAVLEFIADAAGTVTGFATTTNQTRRLPFARVG